MPEQLRSTFPPIVAIQKPLCLSCQQPMSLRGIEFGSDGFDFRMFECGPCDSSQRMTIASVTKRSNPLEWVDDRMKPPD